MLDVVHLYPSRSPGIMDSFISNSACFLQPPSSSSSSSMPKFTNLHPTSQYSSLRTTKLPTSHYSSLRTTKPHLLKCFFSTKLTPSSSSSSSSSSSFVDHQHLPPQINTPIEIAHHQNPIKMIFNLLNTLRKPAATAILVGLLLMYNPNQALAASGGRVGGRSFSSSSSSRTYSAPSGGYSAPSMRGGSGLSYSVPYFGPSPFGGVYMAPAAAGIGSSFFLIITAFAAFVLVSGFLSDTGGGTSVLADTQNTTVLKLQVGLLGLGRSLQQDLNRIANEADTSTSEGLHYVLTETMLALLRHPDYCISGYSSVDVKKSVDDGEKRFNQLSIEERGKFDEETLVNMNNIKKQSATGRRTNGFSNEYIVVTVLVAAVGVHKLPSINNSKDLKEALQKLASIPSSRTLAVEVLWTPQDEGDTLSERELLEDYPLLRPL